MQLRKRTNKPTGGGMSRFQRRVVVGFTGLSVAVSAYAWCPPQYQEAWVYPAFAWSASTITGTITALDLALSAQLWFQSERLISAVAILTKQKAVAANQISDGLRNTNQNIAVSLNALAQAERVKKARFEYGGDFGQGYSPCYVFQGRLGISRAESDLNGMTAAALRTEVQAAPGRFANPVNAQKEMLEQHNALFCTKDQADSGLCSAPGSLAGASLNVATLFKPTAGEEDLTKAKVAFINNMAGLPDGEVPQGGSGSEVAASYQQAKIQKDAVRSSALASLKQIQLETTSGQDGEHSHGDLPLSKQYENEIKRYAGNTPEYQNWSRVMAAQNDRGAMVELLKIKALDLSLQERQYRQWERMEAQLASAVAAKLKSQSRKSDAAANAALRQTATSKLGS